MPKCEVDKQAVVAFNEAKSHAFWLCYYIRREVQRRGHLGLLSSSSNQETLPDSPTESSETFSSGDSDIASVVTVDSS